MPKLLKQALRKNGIPSNVLVMPADVYATEVNNYDKDAANDYFYTMTQEAKRRNFQVSPWSQIRRDNQQTYDRILKREASLEALWASTPKPLWENLLAAADRRSKQSEGDIAKAAFDYLKSASLRRALSITYTSLSRSAW